MASKLVNEIEESDKKIIYLKNVQRQLRVSISFVFTLLCGNVTQDKKTELSASSKQKKNCVFYTN